jgi:hypothetical protein
MYAPSIGFTPDVNARWSLVEPRAVPASRNGLQAEAEDSAQERGFHHEDVGLGADTLAPTHFHGTLAVVRGLTDRSIE